jgi:hypothetical protein
MLQVRKRIRRSSVIRLGVAFVVGLALGFLASKIGGNLQNVVPFLLFPLLIGVAGALTVTQRVARPYVLALVTCLIGWIGISVSLLIMAALATPKVCASGSCWNSGVLASLLIVYVLAGLALTALGALATSALMQYRWRGRGDTPT